MYLETDSQEIFFWCNYEVFPACFAVHQLDQDAKTPSTVIREIIIVGKVFIKSFQS